MPSDIAIKVEHVSKRYEIAIRQLAEKIKNIVGYTGKIVWDATKPDGQPRRMLDTTRAKSEFGFSARIRFDEGMRGTIDWYTNVILSKK